MNRQNPSSKVRQIIRCAETLSEVERAWRLVYHTYLTQGIIHSNSFGIHATAPAASRHSCVAYDSVDEQVVSTMTMIRDSGCGLPLDSVVCGILDKLRARGRKLVETGMLAVRRADWRYRQTGLFWLIRWAIYFTLHEEADDIIIGVHPHHVGFYSRGLGFETLTPVLRYSTLRGKPVVVLRLRLRERLDCGEALPRGLAFIARNPIDRETYDHRYAFPSIELAGSSLAAYLKAHADGHLSKRLISVKRPTDFKPLVPNPDAVRSPFFAVANVG